MLELLNIHFSFCVAKVKLIKVYHELTVAAGSIFFCTGPIKILLVELY